MPRRRIMIAGLLVVLAAAGVWGWTALARPASRGNITQALHADVAAMDQQQMLALVSNLKLEGSTQPQRLELFTRLKERFDAMSLTDKIGLILEMRKAVQANPESPVVDNGRLLMQTYWNRELDAYRKAPPEQRTKMLDARIDEALVFEDLDKLQNAARGLFGGKGGPSQDDLMQMRSQIVKAMVDAMNNFSPEERAAAAQYMDDMRARRSARGLPNRF